ncbi:uncharacterized protein BO66DRAFT_469902 [Aspergillus aculeatinus CBS 121060]|uniref:Uncharacterized protein n=1 Tax=Aspergillus aculeatinus CBS 121060 TaxID=1448322 RepID=A0ACD1HF11_9EURO|nr:hypothetical protein BO66DRAFT_469902 [Aspergillus aculeatinus CBS 121060]RAH72183.1 hypothetical protein BO66DRAFT_469902 [Aspergillus aculeatinus CBS 121060]
MEAFTVFFISPPPLPIATFTNPNPPARSSIIKMASAPGASLTRAIHLTATILMLNLLLFVAFLRDIDPSSELSHRHGLCQSIHRKERRIIHLSSLILGLEPADPSHPDDPEAHPHHSTVDAQAMQSLATSPTATERVSGSSLRPKRPLPAASILSLRPSNRPVKRSRGDSAVTSHSAIGSKTANSVVEVQQQQQQNVVYPPRMSDSIYSATLRRSLSLGSDRRQSIVLPHIRYSGFMTERLRFSVLSQPWSMVSVVAPESNEVPAHHRAEPVVVEETMDRLQPACSVESYPGQFPISDGVELSWLATATQRPGAGPAEDEENNAPTVAPGLQTSMRPYTEV